MIKKIFSFFPMLICLHFAKAQTSFINIKYHQFLLNNQPYYFIGANYWYRGLLPSKKDKSKGIDRLRKELEGDPYIGDPPMEEQWLNIVFISDKSTWHVIDSVYQKSVKVQ